MKQDRPIKKWRIIEEDEELEREKEEAVFRIKFYFFIAIFILTIMALAYSMVKTWRRNTTIEEVDFDKITTEASLNAEEPVAEPSFQAESIPPEEENLQALPLLPEDLSSDIDSLPEDEVIEISPGEIIIEE